MQQNMNTSKKIGSPPAVTTKLSSHRQQTKKEAANETNHMQLLFKVVGAASKIRGAVGIDLTLVVKRPIKREAINMVRAATISQAGRLLEFRQVIN
jgi:hypothetical protein